MFNFHTIKNSIKTENVAFGLALTLLTLLISSCSEKVAPPFSVPDNSSNSQLISYPGNIPDNVPAQSSLLSIIPPSDINLPATGELTQVNLGSATALNAQGAYRFENNAPFYGFRVGTTQVTWSVIDSTNNTANVVQNVTIYEYPTPNVQNNNTVATPLQIKQLSEKQIESSGAITPVILDQPVIIGGVPPYSISNNIPAAGLPNGSYTVTWLVSDITGNQAYAYQPISIVSVCDGNNDFFNQSVWPVLKSKCMRCHNVNGSQTSFNLLDESITGFNAANFSMFKSIAKKTTNTGTSLFLIKPINRNNDHGGGNVLTEASAEFSVIKDLVKRLQSCTQTLATQDTLIVADYVTTLRKATLALANRLPTEQENNFIAQTTDPAIQQQTFEQLLSGVMSEEAFIERIKTIFNDKLLTNEYAMGARGLSLALNTFNNKDYFSDANLTTQGYDKTNRTLIRNNAGQGIALAPLELIAHLLRNDKPFTEILTADYVMVNPYSATVFSASISGNPAFNFTYGDVLENKSSTLFVPAKLIDKNNRAIPHAGVLSTLPFLARFPSTPTNINRKRAATIFKLFLDTEIEGLASRGALDLENVIGQFPTLEDPQCKVCHDVMDPVAGLFKNWSDSGEYRGDFTKWGNTKTPAEILAPGFSKAPEDILPATESGTALAWLAKRIANDSRFALAISKILFEALTGQTANSDTAFFETLKNTFVENNYNLKSLIKAIVSSEYFRAEKLLNNSNGNDYSQYGTAQLLGPEQLNGKINALIQGYTWTSPGNKTLTDINTYNVLYGGIDSQDVITRSTKPTGIMAAIQQRVAFQSSCETVPLDFSKPVNNRIYFKFVEATDLPSDPQSYNRILQNIQYLFKYLLAENHELNSVEISQVYDLFVAAMANSSENNIPTQCRAGLAADNPLIVDPNQTVRAWMAVIGFFFLDYKFLYQ